MTDTSGPTSLTPFATYDPDSSSWKTSGDTSLWGSNEYKGTWPKRGMTRSGSAFQLPMPERPTVARGSSSLLKTPTAQLAINGGSQHPDKRKAGGHGPTLADEVEHLLPTPAAAALTSDLELQKSGDGREKPNKLGWAIALLPTPAAMNPNDGESVETWEARRLRTKERVGNGNGFGTPLAIAVQLLGASTLPQSSDGNPSLDDSLPPPLFQMDETASIA